MQNTRRGRAPLSVALDLGSTRIKVAQLDRMERLTGVESVAAPPLQVRGVTCESDPELYARVAGCLLQRVAGGPASTIPIGLASQRSTFVLWDRNTGRPLLPMVSWLDRRGAEWCSRNAEFLTGASRRTGLVFSGHHVGPKLATLFGTEPDLTRSVKKGRLQFGTLETYLLWKWSDGRVHETDLSMAARTGLVDISTGDWSEPLLQGFGVPRSILPRIRPTSGWRVPLGGGREAAASVADQAAAALSVFEPGGICALVNLGTGGFVLRPVSGFTERPPGYLVGPLLGNGMRSARYALEGTINGAAFTLDRLRTQCLELPGTDPSPASFALPEMGGLGAPHWRSDLDLVLSPAAQRLDSAGLSRVILEGLLFRVREILEGLFPGSLPDRIVLTGGLARLPVASSGLAALLAVPLEVPEEPECTLLGAARLAAGREPSAGSPSLSVLPGKSGCYLDQKYRNWKDWVDSVLGK